jgi:predicted dehydrogenase
MRPNVVNDARVWNGAGEVGRPPFAVPVVLFGWGDWSKKAWAAPLVTLARWSVIHLTVVDRWPVVPPGSELSALTDEGVLTYLAWDGLKTDQLWEVAFVVTGADSHVPVICRLLEKAQRVRVIVCEKPCGQSLDDAQRLFEACRQIGVVLLMSDHYLLRPPVQYLLANRGLLCQVGELVEIIATLNETKASGPSQGVVADMKVHLLDLLLALFPSAEFIPETAQISRTRTRPHTSEEGYCSSTGWLLIPSRTPVLCRLECGKELAVDQKELTFVGTRGRIHLDLIANSFSMSGRKEVYLRWTQPWSYGRLIIRALWLNTSRPARSQH